MIRVKIAGEEVLSNKNFTITEELLKTSSTILDNVYPKAWEETHDYVNNFYFPKDYSSCTIENVEPITPIIGTRVSGSNMSINYDNTLSWDLEQLKGNTTQQTYTGKNLLPYPYSTTGTTSGGLTYAVQNDGGIKITGTKNGTSYMMLLGTGLGDYTTERIRTTSKLYSNSGSGIEIKARLTNATYIETELIPANQSIGCLYLEVVSANNTQINTTFYPIITYSSDTTYEPYVGGTPSPNPSYPQPINNVTGRQEIDVVGKNLFDGEIELGSFDASGNPTSSDNCVRTKNFTRIQPNAEYTISNDLNYQNVCFIYDKNFNLIRGTGNVVKITTQSNDYYIKWRSSAVNVENNLNVKWQLEEGSTATIYETYIGKQYEINLGKNLFDKDNVNTLNASINSSGTISSNANCKTIYIPIQPNTTYTISKVLSTQFRASVYDNTPIINSTGTNTIANFSGTTITITSTANSKYLAVFCYINTDTKTLQEILDSIQIEKGNQATTYAPYKTPIELCKIGDYQDYIYKNNNKWYIHKEINKNTFIGSNTDTYNFNSDNTNTLALNINPNGVSNNFVKKENVYSLYCDNFIYEHSINDKEHVYVTGAYDVGNNFRLYINKSRLTGYSSSMTNAQKIELVKTWLSSNPIQVYSISPTPTYTEITDTELINQLEDIELLNGLNNISIISPNENGELQIYYNYRNAGEDTELIFAGLVKNSGSISLRPTDPKYCSLQILDYKTLLSEGQTLDYVINNKTIKEAIQMVINSVTSYGFIEGNIDIDAANDVIGAYSTLNKTPYDVFQYLADISQSKWFTRVIDEKTIAIDFYDPDKLPKADDIEYTEQYFKDNNIVDINYSFSSSDYRNKQIILSEKVYGNVAVNDVITCNGYEQTFTTSQIIGTISSIKVNNVEKTYATNTEKSLGIIVDFYYAPNNNTVESAELYDAGDIIVISYMPLIKGRRVITNDDEISRINNQINRNGIISRYEERNDIVDGDELGKVAETYIRYKGTSEIKLNVLTENKDLFNIGQQVYFDMPNVERLATDYMVKKKNIEIIQTGEYKNVFYTYELTSNFNSETDINFFDNQRRKAEGNISEDQFITRNVDVNNTANIIFDNLQIEEVQTTGNNTLNCTLNSPFIN